jgi:type I restriction enzyme, S subunit
MDYRWEEKYIGEIAEVIGGGTPKTNNSEFWEGNIPWITPKDLSNHKERYISRGERNISEIGLQNSSARMLPKDTVLLSSRAPIGYVAISKNPITTNQGFKSLVLKTGYAPEFYYYFLKSNVGILESYATGSTFKEISGSIVKSIKVPVPPLTEQQAIARILSSLDDKIELNQEMNRTLEVQARAIFKSWFVDFDPVRAKIDGRQPTGMDAATAALFPDAFEESELGLIPKGWKIGKIGQEFDLTMGQSPPGSTYNEDKNGIPFYQGTRDFGFRYPTERIYCSAPTRFANSGDTLVSVRAPVGDINMANQQCCIGRGVAAIRHKQGSRSYTYYSMQGLTSHFDKYEAEGTVFGSINKQDFNSIPCIIHPLKLVSKFEELVHSIDRGKTSEAVTWGNLA